MPYLSERQRLNIETIVKDLDARVECEVVNAKEGQEPFLIILKRGDSEIRVDVSEDDLEDAANDPKTQSEMRWRLKKALQKFSDS